MVYWFSYLTLSLLCSALLCYALLCLGWYQLLCLWVHPLWKQSGFIVVFPVCTLGAPRRIKERFHLCLCLVWPPGLAQPYHGGENMVSALFDALFWSDDDTQFMLCQSTKGFTCLKTIALLLLKICYVLHVNSGKYFVLHVLVCKCSCLHASIWFLLTELLITHPLSL